MTEEPLNISEEDQMPERHPDAGTGRGDDAGGTRIPDQGIDRAEPRKPDTGSGRPEGDDRDRAPDIRPSRKRPGDTADGTDQS